MNSKALFLCALVALSSPCKAAKFTVLHSFGSAGDGAQPLGALSLDSKGNIYGTTEGGGTDEKGTVFVVHGNGTEKVIHSFRGGHDGSEPVSGVVSSAAGLFCGVEPLGGRRGGGTVFGISPKGKKTVLYAFRGGRHDGRYPQGSLTIFPNGTIYGTTVAGGTQDFGTIFNLTPDGTETVLHSLTDAEGDDAALGVIGDANGVLYGVAGAGGSSFEGTIFSLTPGGVYTVLHNFTGVQNSDGTYPSGGLVFGLDGNLYGVTQLGGVNNGGTLFRISPDGTNYEILHAFEGSAGGNADDGSLPQGNLAIDGAGNVFGTTKSGGADATAGTVFEYTSDGSYRIVHTFIAATDGASPVSGVTVGPKNTLYGTTNLGGLNNRGTVFSIKLTN